MHVCFVGRAFGRTFIYCVLYSSTLPSLVLKDFVGQFYDCRVHGCLSHSGGDPHWGQTLALDVESENLPTTNMILYLPPERSSLSALQRMLSD